MSEVSVDRYIYPPRPHNAVPYDDAVELYSSLGWKAQLKFNDTRCLVKLFDGQVELWNRHGEKIRGYVPPEELVGELLELGRLLGPGHHLLDGGLLDQKHRAIKDTVVLWDVLVRGGEYLKGTEYAFRYGVLLGVLPTIAQQRFVFDGLDLGACFSPNVFMPDNFSDPDWAVLWEEMERVNKPFLDKGYGPLLEGLVFKDLSGVLQRGSRQRNNEDWLAKSRFATGRHNF